MEYINKAYLLIGGNVGNSLYYLNEAAELIQMDCGKVVNRSPIYETAPWGNTNQPAFLNQALELQTSFPAGELMTILLKIEEKMGRQRSEKFGPRIIDIDILLFNEEVHTGAELTIPHKELQNRRFVLQPLCDIAPSEVHPVLKKSIQELLLECPDNLPVKRIFVD
jgi:2-amino-4-hydroxy-6-hydroxymethyldihydropteridine diphosphokinase